MTEPFPIQAATLPNSLAGRDVLGRGRTGSGKTLAFGLALLARTAGQRAEPRQPLALVLVPTRELAQQVTDALTPYARSLRLRLATVVGGMSIGRQASALRGGAEVVVATPGTAQGPHRPRRLPAGPGRHHGAGRGRPDGRHGLHAAGHRAARPGAPRAASGCCSRPPWTATSTCWSAATCTDPVVHSVDPSAGAVTTMEHHVLHVHARRQARDHHRDRRPRRPGA